MAASGMQVNDDSEAVPAPRHATSNLGAAHRSDKYTAVDEVSGDRFQVSGVDPIP